MTRDPHDNYARHLRLQAERRRSNERVQSVRAPSMARLQATRDDHDDAMQSAIRARLDQAHRFLDQWPGLRVLSLLVKPTAHCVITVDPDSFWAVVDHARVSGRFAADGGVEEQGRNERQAQVVLGSAVEDGIRLVTVTRERARLS